MSLCSRLHSRPGWRLSGACNSPLVQHSLGTWCWERTWMHTFAVAQPACRDCPVHQRGSCSYCHCSSQATTVVIKPDTMCPDRLVMRFDFGVFWKGTIQSFYLFCNSHRLAVPAALHRVWECRVYRVTECQVCRASECNVYRVWECKSCRVSGCEVCVV